MHNDLSRTIEKAVHSLGFTLHKVILFGSRAKGESHPDSDWDILVVIEEPLTRETKKELWYKVFKALHCKFRMTAFDVIVKSKHEHEKDLQVIKTV